MSTIDQQFVEYIVKTLVNNPDKVKIDREIDEKGVLLSLSVDPEDVGRVIGRRGMTAQSIRTLLRALGTKNDARYNLKIVDEGGERISGERPQNNFEHREMPRPMTRENTEYEQTEPTEARTVDDSYDAPAETETYDEPEETEEETSSELAEKTRQELADLDDLEI